MDSLLIGLAKDEIADSALAFILQLVAQRRKALRPLLHPRLPAAFTVRLLTTPIAFCQRNRRVITCGDLRAQYPTSRPARENDSICKQRIGLLTRQIVSFFKRSEQNAFLFMISLGLPYSQQLIFLVKLNTNFIVP